jgi:UDP-N-acetylglucosamine acyltransferase
MFEMAQIHQTAVVAKTAVIADDAVIGPNCCVGERTAIGPRTVLAANVVIENDVTIGAGNHLFPNAVIGCSPQLLGIDPSKKLGGLVIGDNNVIREGVTIHPSMYPGHNTTIGSNNLLMVGVHVGHDCIVEDKIVISNCTQLSGHCKVETGAWLSALSGAHQFVTIGKWAYVGGLSGVTHDITPFIIVSGAYPLRVRSINKRGISRAGLTPEQGAEVVRAFRRLYRSEGALLDNALLLSREPNLDASVQAMVDSVINSSRHRFGRHLETLRSRH